MTLKKLSPYLILSLIFLILFTQSKCERDITSKNYKANTEAFMASIDSLQNINTSLVSSNEALTVHSLAKEAKILELSNRPNRVRTITKIDTKFVFQDTGSTTSIVDQLAIDSLREELGLIKLERDSLSNIIAYQGYYTDEWLTVNSTSFPDVTYYDITFEEKLLLSHEVHKKLFKEDSYLFTAKSLNPYVRNQSIQTYRVSPKPQRFSLGFNLGYGANIQGTTVIAGPQVSFGLNYNLINF